MHLLIIGGSDAGISAALRAHELLPAGQAQSARLQLVLDLVPERRRGSDRRMWTLRR